MPPIIPNTAKRLVKRPASIALFAWLLLLILPLSVQAAASQFTEAKTPGEIIPLTMAGGSNKVALQIYWSPKGCNKTYPVGLLIDNKSGTERSYSVTIVTRNEMGIGLITTENTFAVAAGTSLNHTLIVPLDVEDGERVMMEIRVRGYGIAENEQGVIISPTYNNQEAVNGSLFSSSIYDEANLLLSALSDGSPQHKSEDAPRFIATALPDNWQAYAGFNHLAMNASEWMGLKTAARRAILDYVKTGGVLGIRILPNQVQEDELSELPFVQEPSAQTASINMGLGRVIYWKNSRSTNSAVEPISRGSISKADTESEGEDSNSDDDKITVDFQDEDIGNIIRQISDINELNVVMPDNLQGNITIKMHEVSWQDLFTVILEPRGYTYVIQGNSVNIVESANRDKLTKYLKSIPEIEFQAQEFYQKLRTTKCNWYLGNMEEMGNHSTLWDALELKKVSFGLVLTLLTLFAILVGPVNLIILARKRKLLHLLWTTPLISILAALMLMVTIFFKDGVGGQGIQVDLVTFLSGENRAFHVLEQHSETYLLAQTAFEIPEGAYIDGYEFNSGSGDGMGLAAPVMKYVEDDRKLSGGWMASRAQQAQRIAWFEPSRNGLQILPTGDYGYEVVSYLPESCNRIYYRDLRDNLWTINELAPGQKAALLPCAKIENDEWQAFVDPATHTQRLMFSTLLSNGNYIAVSEDDPANALVTLPSIHWKKRVVYYVGQPMR